MISLEALSAAGLSNKKLREILTSRPPEQQGKRRVPVEKNANKGSTFTGSTVATPVTLEKLPENPTNWDRRCYLETMVRSEIIEGQMRCAQNFNRFGAVDLAYSSIPIHPLVSNLMQVAMGHLSVEDCERNISGLSEETKKKLFERDARGKAVGINAPQLIPVAHNLVHSLVTRRVAALATEVYQQFPLMRYDTFSTTQTSRLAGDVMTQLAEQMAGMYGYRHDYEESIRQASLYTNSFKFKSSAWFVEKQTLPIPVPIDGASNAGKKAKPKLERRIVNEGVLFKLPHPSRVYYDISEPLSKLNSSAGGPKWIGHWEVVTIGSVIDNPAYYNTDVLTLDIDLYSWMGSYGSYFAQYYNGCATLTNAERINPNCNRGCTSAAALSLANDRESNIGAWAQSYRGSSTVLTQHYKCIIPKNHGLGTYEDPVWFRFVMAANTTIVFAEILGSAPASVNGYNASDGLLMSPSFAMQAIQWQQDLTNDLNELAHITAQGLVRIWVVNTDGMRKEEIEVVENALKNPDFAELKDIVIKYKRSLLEQRAENPQNITEKISQIRVETATKTTEIFNRMVQKLALAERLMFFSPSELGQVSPRTTTATEQKAVQNTTLGIRDFHLIGVKQMIDADKRIIHDSYMAFGSEDLEVPVAERYEPAVIEAAGFEIVDDGSGNPPDGLFTIRGKKLGLLYNYVYTTRNTDDTPPEAQVAQGMAQVYEIMAKDPVISENTTLDQRYEFVNSIMTILAPTIAKLRVPPGVDGKKTIGGQMQAMQDQLKQILPQIGQQFAKIAQQQAQQAQQIGQLDAGQTALAAALSKLSSVLEAKAPEPTPVRQPAGPAMPGGRVNAPGQPIAGTIPTLRPRSRATAVPLIG